MATMVAPRRQYAAQFGHSNERNMIVNALQEIDMGVPDFAGVYEPHLADGAGDDAPYGVLAVAGRARRC